jgi:DNA-binding Lrp family transcriptional regulator
MNTQPDRENEVVKVLRDTPGIERADIVYGVFDIIAVANVKHLNDLGCVIQEVRARTQGIEKTSTMIVKEDYAAASEA